MANDGNLDVLVTCGSPRMGSYNRALARMLPKLAPPAMRVRDAPPFEFVIGSEK
jgi:NAD(P)H-dependent FMN reductase